MEQQKAQKEIENKKKEELLLEKLLKQSQVLLMTALQLGQFPSLIQTFSSCSSHTHIHSCLQEERKITAHLLEIKQQKDIIRQNRIAREQEIAEKKRREFEENLERDAKVQIENVQRDMKSEEKNSESERSSVGSVLITLC